MDLKSEFDIYKYHLIHRNPSIVLIGLKKYTKIPAKSQGGGHVDRIKVHF